MRSYAKLSVILVLLLAGCGAESSRVKIKDKTKGERKDELKDKSTAVPAARRGNALLVSWDGVRRDVLKEMLEAGKLPNLAGVIKAGSLQDIVIRGQRTQTRPGHAKMLTGLCASQTGISANSSPGCVPAGCTLFDRLRKAPRTGKVATIVVTGKTYVGTLFAESRASIDTYDAGSRLAEATGPAALSALARHRQQRFFAFVHFSDPDAAGHSSGEGSDHYLEAIVTCDRWLGLILGQLRKHGLEEKTAVYVTTDHGFDKGRRTHQDAPEIWLATSDRRVTRGGELADIPATILSGFGLDPGKLEPPLLGKPLTGGKPAGKTTRPAKKKAA